MSSSESEIVDVDSDDSQEDPTFRLPSNPKIMSSIINVDSTSEDEDDISDVVEVPAIPELDEEGKKKYESIKSIIDAGKVENLKLDECKIYLRKHGLRLTGKKDVLIQRIKEHISIMDEGGQQRYPLSSFVLNCKGDACVGDTVMFVQKVNEVGKCPGEVRLIVGRIVKESYGAAKQQHTFTIEVLWSKGKKPLPPLHPLLIKGRNLYKLKTMRQKWDDEGERLKILSEKHARGNAARMKRDIRIRQKEMRNICRQTRESRNEHPTNTRPEQDYMQRTNQQPRTREANEPRIVPPPTVPPPYHRRQPLADTDCNFRRDHHGRNHEGQPHLNYHSSSSTIAYQPSTCKENTSYSMRTAMQEISHPIYVQSLPPPNHAAYPDPAICRYYKQGRCYYGDRCKYVHK
ncbi:zinc finger CCCH domain-containing protein 62 isoform X2 [Andrographis paniculata]|uniref:zinc finger CCCH domain-containing protein 62 isoform X2 n=1 Tax=Andrographis paniculata TaxID=175694 RepID=UPI0021E8DCFD|nr:zinc finger CCCH domain-containing protein 62 isoform X2 [Andrographis paniculata]